MKLKPLADRVVIKLVEAEEKTKSCAAFSLLGRKNRVIDVGFMHLHCRRTPRNGALLAATEPRHAGFGASGSSYTLVNNPASTAAETNSAVTDSTGQLLFFVDGGSIYNSTGALMQNGSGIKAQSSAEQDSVSFANPAKQGEYYVITNNTVTGGFVSPTSDRTWYYSIVDMTANGGLGAVTVKTSRSRPRQASAAKHSPPCPMPPAPVSGWWALS